MLIATTHLRGHKIVYDYSKGIWRYNDNGQPTVNNERPCGYCNQDRTKEGHDACLGTLAGIMNACCGHGIVKDTYNSQTSIVSEEKKPLI